MNSFDSQRSTQQDAMKRRWQSFNHHHHHQSNNNNNNNNNNTFFFTKLMETAPSPFPAIPRNPSFTSKQPHHRNFFPGPETDDGDLVSSVVPPVTVVLEGRSICQRISLQKHESYQSLARALRQMFVEEAEADDSTKKKEKEKLDELDLANAIPGYLIAYEDMENDLLLAGDLDWKDFVRVAKRIRIVPVKSNSRKSPQRSSASA